jgi:hypothetical protein
VAGALGGAGLAGKVGVEFIRKLLGKCHSFAPTTPVLMADGSSKADQYVQVGDQVAATDPETGETEAEPVEQLHLNHDSRRSPPRCAGRSDRTPTTDWVGWR